MSEPNPKVNFPRKSLISQNPLIDSLTSHISLYHSFSLPPNPNPNSSPRSAILKWFSSLTVQQRQANITIVDSKFVQILIQMLNKLQNHGHGSFIILPDLPSGDLPSLCFKKSRGLLSRVAEANDSERWVSESTRLFSSREGENVKECSVSASCLDSLTMSEEFVENVERIVEVMDRMSNGEFLRGEEGELGSDWVELGWLKSKGYYSMVMFIANRLEVALRLAWLNATNTRKRGVKLKEKVAAAGVAANVFWRKKGCVDWWENLDDVIKRKILGTVLGKAAKPLMHEILKYAANCLEDKKGIVSGLVGQSLSNKHSSLLCRTSLTFGVDTEFGLPITSASHSGQSVCLPNVFNSLLMLQEFCRMVLSFQSGGYEKEKLFLSTLHSLHTVYDCVLRKLRGFLMIISLDCTKLELLGEENDKPSTKKSKQKHGTSNCRKKKRNSTIKSQIPVTRSCTDGVSSNKVSKDLCPASSHKQEKDVMGSEKVHGSQSQGEEIEKEVSKTEKEHSKDGKNQPAARKGRKHKSKSKTISFKNAAEKNNAAGSAANASSSSVSSQEKAFSSNLVCNNSTIQGDTNAKSTTDERSTWEDDAVQGVQENLVADSVKASCSTEVKSFHISESVIEDPIVSSACKSSNCKADSGAIPPLQVNEVSCLVSNEDTGLLTSMHPGKTDASHVLVNKSINESDVKEGTIRIHEHCSGNLSDTKPKCPLECSSYEWPTYSLYFSPINSNLPTATDRLHLEVGHNWHGHSRQSLVPAVHHARKSVVEGGCNGMLSQPLAMSLDWPPMVRSACGLAPSATCNYDSGFISRRQSAFQHSFGAQNVQLNGSAAIDDERNYSWDFMDVPDAASFQDLGDEGENHGISEEEIEVHTVSGIDYNQYFGGGVMYWNPSDHPGSSFSRPPSLSSDDSSWAWREADMNRAVDEMVAFSSSYSTNGLTSPTASSFCSPFDPLGSGHQALGYVMPGNEVSSKMLHSPSTMTDTAAEEEVSRSSSLPNDIEGKTGDSFPYPILRPIIIPNMSRERSRSEFNRNHDHKSPRVPPGRREQLRIKRPPSPVVLSVPRAPRPPPPSPVSDSRKHRGFPTVRSGSSSPRHWGIRGWYQEGTTMEEMCLRMDGPEVVWPSWRNKNLSAHAMIQPLPGALLQDHLIAMSQLARDQEHPDVAFPLQPADLQSCSTRKESLSLMHSLLNDEIECFCQQVAGENMARKPYINWAVKRVTRSLQVLWPRSRTNVFGSNATGLSLPSSDVDLVVCLPPVRNLEPIKEAGILEGRNGIKETCLQHAARYLANQEWVKSDSLKTVENTAIPIIMLVVEVPHDFISSTSNVQSPKEELSHVAGDGGTHSCSDAVGVEDSTLLRCSQMNHNKTKDSKSVRLDISFKTSSHTGLQTTELVKELTEQFPAAAPLALILKKFLADRSLDQSYSGGLSSYCLVLLIIRFLQHEYHLGRPINQNFGSLLMDFLYFFGNVFDPRQMRISVQGSGLYIKRERGYSIDPLHIDDPLFSTNNVGRNCFRIHQCIKAFSEAYSVLEDGLECLPKDVGTSSEPPYRLLRKIIPSIDLFREYKV